MFFTIHNIQIHHRLTSSPGESEHNLLSFPIYTLNLLPPYLPNPAYRLVLDSYYFKQDRKKKSKDRLGYVMSGPQYFYLALD